MQWNQKWRNEFGNYHISCFLSHRADELPREKVFRRKRRESSINLWVLQYLRSTIGGEASKDSWIEKGASWVGGNPENVKSWKPRKKWMNKCQQIICTNIFSAPAMCKELY